MPAAHEYIVKLFDKEIMEGEFQKVGIIQVAAPAKSSAVFDKFVSGCIASGRVMNTEPNAGEDLVTVAAGGAVFRVSCPSPHTAPQIGIRFTVKSPGDVHPKSLQSVSRGSQ